MSSCTGRLQDCKAVKAEEIYHIHGSVQNNHYSLDVSHLRANSQLLFLSEHASYYKRAFAQESGT